MGTAAAGSNMTFSPSQNGTSLDLQAGLEARVRENITPGRSGRLCPQRQRQQC
ncbi:hypothetical protein P4909_20505 [Escherichia coli]